MWGGGWLASNGAKDFAGGVVLHATAGSSCLVACKLLGPRRGHQKDQESGGFPYSNIVTSTIGASILWVRACPHMQRASFPIACNASFRIACVLPLHNTPSH